MPKPKKMSFASLEEYCRDYEENAARFGKKWENEKTPYSEIVALLTLAKKEQTKVAVEAGLRKNRQ